MKTKSLLLSLLTIPLLTAGCASIVDGGRKSVQLDSNPEGAKVTISTLDGTEVLVTNTPAKVKLERGGSFQGANYKIAFEKPGYYPYEAHVESEMDPWIFGNALFGGLIGIAIDGATGDMYTLSPRELNCNLTTTTAPATATESAKKAPGN